MTAKHLQAPKTVNACVASWWSSRLTPLKLFFRVFHQTITFRKLSPSLAANIVSQVYSNIFRKWRLLPLLLFWAAGWPKNSVTIELWINRIISYLSLPMTLYFFVKFQYKRSTGIGLLSVAVKFSLRYQICEWRRLLCVSRVAANDVDASSCTS